MSECEVANYIKSLKFKKSIIGINEKQVLLELENINNIYRNIYEKLEKEYIEKIQELEKQIKIKEKNLNKLLLEKKDYVDNIEKNMEEKEYYAKVCEKLSLKYLELEEEKTKIIENAKDEEVRAKEILIIDLNRKEQMYKDKLKKYKEECNELEKKKRYILDSLAGVKNDIDRIMS